MTNSPQKTSKKKMTIDDPARIVAHGFESVKTELRDEFRGGIRSLSERIDNIDERFDAVDTRFNRMDDRFDDVDKRFDTLEAGTHRRLTIVEGSLKTLMKK